MLYNPQWNALTLDSFVAWLEQQPADDNYDFFDHNNCLVAQYLTAKGYRNVFAWAQGFYHGDKPIEAMNQRAAEAQGLMTYFPQEFNKIANYGASTFRSALKRARYFQKLARGVQ